MYIVFCCAATCNRGTGRLLAVHPPVQVQGQVLHELPQDELRWTTTKRSRFRINTASTTTLRWTNMIYYDVTNLTDQMISRVTRLPNTMTWSRSSRRRSMWWSSQWPQQCTALCERSQETRALSCTTWSWLCLPISTITSARQRRMQGPSRDRTGCETSRIQRWQSTSTEWTKRWSWLCLPISTIPSSRQRRLQDPSWDRTCCETTRIQRRQNSPMGSTKKKETAHETWWPMIWPATL